MKSLIFACLAVVLLCFVPVLAHPAQQHTMAQLQIQAMIYGDDVAPAEAATVETPAADEKAEEVAEAPATESTAETEESAPLDLSKANLTTYAGITVIVVALLGLLKNFAKDFMKGKEKIGALILAIAIGCLAKGFQLGFVDADWVTHCIALLTAAVSAGIMHDKVTNPLLEFLGGSKKTANPDEA